MPTLHELFVYGAPEQAKIKGEADKFSQRIIILKYLDLMCQKASLQMVRNSFIKNFKSQDAT